MSRQIRKSTGDAYYSLDGMVKPKVVSVIDGNEIKSSHTLKADACVIGSGAGGSVVAKELAEAGLDVIVLEAGPHITTEDLSCKPHESIMKLYAKAGQSFAHGATQIMLPYSNAIGGTTLINSGTCFRTPKKTLDSWSTDFGIEIDQQSLDCFFRRVEKEINVAQIPAEAAGKNSSIIRNAAKELGWSGDYLFRNVRGCKSSGICAFGCPTSAKQHTGITYMAKSWNAGSQTYSNTKVTEIVHHNGKVYGVKATTKAQGRLRINSELVIIACGTIATPTLLKASGLGLGSGQLGNNLSLHPASSLIALMEEEVRMWEGVPQSYYIDQFTDEGLIFESATGPPDFISISAALSSDLMLKADHLAQFGLMVSDTGRGRILSKGQHQLAYYQLTKTDVSRIKRGFELLTKLFSTAGASEVILPIGGGMRLPANEDSANKIAQAKIKASDLKLISFHPLGSARAHNSQHQGVVDSNLKLHDCEGVYVSDGSVMPTPLGVNPQLTIMTLANRLAYHLLDKADPSDEPYPEKIPKPKGREPYNVISS